MDSDKKDDELLNTAPNNASSVSDDSAASTPSQSNTSPSASSQPTAGPVPANSLLQDTPATNTIDIKPTNTTEISDLAKAMNDVLNGKDVSKDTPNNEVIDTPDEPIAEQDSPEVADDATDSDTVDAENEAGETETVITEEDRENAAVTAAEISAEAEVQDVESQELAVQPDIQTSSEAVPNFPAPSKGKKIATIVGISIIAIVFLAASGYGLYTLSKRLGSLNTPKTENVSTIPQGWKQFKTKSLGVSFIAPEKWTVSEQNLHDQNPGIGENFGYTIKVSMPSSGSSDSGTIVATMQFTKSSLDIMAAQVSSSFSDTASATLTDTTWNNHKAIVVTSNSSDATKQPTSFQLVEIAPYVVSLPNPDSKPAAIDDVELSPNSFKRFADSIKISADDVAAFADTKNNTVQYETANDVDYKDFQARTGWGYNNASDGLTFATKIDWVVTTPDTKNTNDTIATLATVRANSAIYTFTVYKTGSLDDVTELNAANLGISLGATTKTEKLSWNGHNARRILVIDEKGTTSSSILIVNINDQNYILPDPSGYTPTSIYNQFNATDFDVFARSVQISDSSN